MDCKSVLSHLTWSLTTSFTRVSCGPGAAATSHRAGFLLHKRLCLDAGHFWPSHLPISSFGPSGQQLQPITIWVWDLRFLATTTTHHAFLGASFFLYRRLGFFERALRHEKRSFGSSAFNRPTATGTRRASRRWLSCFHLLDFNQLIGDWDTSLILSQAAAGDIHSTAMWRIPSPDTLRVCKWR